jgi:mRNA interferase MazF
MIKRGDIFYADLLEGKGSEQNGQRPVVILQNNKGNRHSPTTIVAIITSARKKSLPTHVYLMKEDSGLKEDSVILLEQIQTLDKQRLVNKVGRLAPKVMGQVDQAARKSLCLERKK